jgi:hypothetical protein
MRSKQLAKISIPVKEQDREEEEEEEDGGGRRLTFRLDRGGSSNKVPEECEWKVGIMTCHVEAGLPLLWQPSTFNCCRQRDVDWDWDSSI